MNLIKLPKKKKPTNAPMIQNEQYREIYKAFSLTVTEEMLKELDDIPHNESINDKEYRYGLSVKNEILFTGLVPLPEEPTLPNTGTENLFNLLSLDKESSYESMLLKFKDEFNTGRYILG
jgi:hypothetical protein